MNITDLIKRGIPKSGLGHCLETYATWAGVGLSGSLLAGFLDSRADLAYAAFYTKAVNDAVGYNFWILLSVIGVLLFFMTLPLIYFGRRHPRLLFAGNQARRLTYTFFLVAFDEGGLMIGILLANYLHGNDRMNMLASRSFLFSGMSLLAITGLALVNSLLWLLGESLYNREDHAYSGLVGLLLDVRIKYLAPAYLTAAGLGMYLILDQ